MSTSAGADLSFESELWKAADSLRSNMDAAEYKHVVLGLIFLKYISDAFEEQHAKLEAERASGADPEDPDEYRAVNVFWVPAEARWSHLRNLAKDPKIGKIVDDAMLAIERDNLTLKGVLPKDYAHPRLDKERLGSLIDRIGNIGLGTKANRSRAVQGTSVRSMLRIGGMFVQSEKFIEEHGGRIGDISVYGQESNHTTWRLAKMNLAIRDIESNLIKLHFLPLTRICYSRSKHRVSLPPRFDARSWH